jgi:hypothetical protein
MFGDLQTKQAITNRAVVICSAVRDALIGTEGVTEFFDWLSAQVDGDLTAQPPAGPGFSQADVNKLRAAFADLNDFALKFTNTLGDGNHPVPYDYRVNVKQIIGPR